MDDVDFYGSATVGERGQIVLPSKLRKKLGIKAGDKILVLGREKYGKWGIMLVKAEVLAKMLEEWEGKIKDIFMKSEGGKRSNTEKE
ncbi:MAG TPA: AbrB/MazE/SpoVT family DNA-binding domain-containing protein [Thermoplasmatales archaeon]|nr:AbrB/MazE/SpoVT family DNA-binding domain-containing protein [Thermoplasmatales archaeon]